MQQYVIKIVSDTACDRSTVFSRYSGVLHNKPDHLDITKISLNVALNNLNTSIILIFTIVIQR